jgi:hypothetical protein
VVAGAQPPAGRHALANRVIVVSIVLTLAWVLIYAAVTR